MIFCTAPARVSSLGLAFVLKSPYKMADHCLAHQVKNRSAVGIPCCPQCTPMICTLELARDIVFYWAQSGYYMIYSPCLLSCDLVFCC